MSEFERVEHDGVPVDVGGHDPFVIATIGSYGDGPGVSVILNLDCVVEVSDESLNEEVQTAFEVALERARTRITELESDDE